MAITNKRHPDRFRTLTQLTKARSRAVLAVDRRLHDQQNAYEFAALNGDQLGFDRRMEYAPTVSHIWETYAASSRTVLKMSDYITCAGDDFEIQRPLPLRCPSVLYADLDGLLPENHKVDGSPLTIEGVYLWRTDMLGDPFILYMVTCKAERELVASTVTLGELTLEKTRVAIGTVDPDQVVTDTLNELIGDPLVCSIVGNTLINNAIGQLIALFQKPGAFPDHSGADYPVARIGRARQP